MNDKRLYIVRNREASRRRSGADADTNEYEYEVFVDAPVQGNCEWGPFRLVVWDSGRTTKRSVSLVLAIEDWLEDAGAGAGGRGGFYHGTSMPGEFCAIASGLLRRAVVLGPLVRAFGVPMRVDSEPWSQSTRSQDERLNLSHLVESLEMVAALPDELHQVFVLACRMYQEALLLMERKPDLAYLLLVSVVEVFVAKTNKRTQVTDFPERVQTALAAIADTETRSVITDRLLEVDRGIGRKFVSFIVEHVDPSFWEVPVRSGATIVGKDELPRLLKRIYEQRSKTLHEAAPFPPVVLEPPDGEHEIFRGGEVQVGDRTFKEREFIPYVRFFERLVQHVLVQFLVRNTTLNGDGAGEPLVR